MLNRLAFVVQNQNFLYSIVQVSSKAKYYSAYEASFCEFNIHRELLNLGIKNIVANAADIPRTDKERKQKEDSRDSRKNAKQLSLKDLKAIYGSRDRGGP